MLVDGTERATIGEGETVTLDLPPNVHRVRVAIDWCRSPELTVDPSRGDVDMTCSAAANPFLAIWLILFRRDAYISLTMGRPG